MEIIDSHKKRILLSLKKEKIVLFLGAGCSKECGIPDSKEIVQILKKSFEYVDFQNDTFLDVCYDIVETPPYTRSDVLKKLKILLKSNNKSPAFELLPKIPLGAIFTTNYDTLIEESFRECNDKPYECYTVKGLQPREPIQSRKYTMVYKLMGSIESEEIENGGPIITTAEYRNSIFDTERYYERLQDAVLDGVLIFIGYSLKDIDVIHTLDKLREKMKENLPYSYFVSPNANMEIQRATKLHERRIIGIDGTFEEFIKELHINSKVEYANIIDEEFCKINKIRIPILKNDFQVHKDEFDLITDESVEKQIIHDKRKFAEDFFKGKISDWSPYSNNIDFIRDLYYDKLWGVIQKELRDKRSQVNKIIMIHGMPGCGKSTLIKRLGFDIYHKQDLPVIYLKNTGILFENRYINKIITFLWEKYTDLQESPGRGEEVKFTILIDNLGNHTDQIVSLFRHLKSQGKPCLFIVAERSHEWEHIKDDFSIKSDDIIEFMIPDQLNDNESKRIIKYLYDLKYIQDSGEHWKNIINEIHDNSFFITIYSIIKHSRKPLEKIISDQYIKLTPNLQKIYLYISVIDQFDGDINVELLIRTLNKFYGEFEEELIIAESDGVFYRQELPSEYIVLKTHHKIIAKKTIEFFASDPEQQKEILKEIISNISPSSEFETNLGMYLVIDCFGPNKRDEIFSLQQKEELLETFLEVEDNKAVRHHLGILQKKLGPARYSDAYSNLLIALEKPQIPIGGRVEFNTNILTSLGDLFIKMALQEEIDKVTYQDIIENGENYLSASIEDDPSNIHAYHAYANLLKSKAMRLGDHPQTFEYYVEALKQAEIGLSFSPEYDNQKLNSIKIELLKILRDFNIAEEYAQELYNKNGDISGYHIIIRLLYEDYKNKYLFSWEKVPGNDSIRLIKFLRQNFNVEWIKAAKINKNDDGKTIRITNDTNFLSLTLNKEKNNVNIEIDDGKTDKFIVKTKNNELNIYKNNYDKSILQNSLKICKKALVLNPIDYNLLSLKFNIIKELDPGNHQYQHQILTQINKLQMKIPLNLRFRYAYLSFLLHYYPTSKNEFYKLKELSIKINESTRSNMQEWITDEKGDKLKLQGEIDRIFSKKLGKIRILDLPGLEWLIPYSPLETKEKLIEGTPIWLNLGFSYAGPIAKNITRRI